MGDQKRDKSYKEKRGEKGKYSSRTLEHKAINVRSTEVTEEMIYLEWTVGDLRFNASSGM